MEVKKIARLLVTFKKSNASQLLSVLFTGNLRRLHRSKKNHRKIINHQSNQHHTSERHHETIKTSNQNFFQSIFKKNYRNMFVIENKLSLSYQRVKSMHYPESPKVTP